MNLPFSVDPYRGGRIPVLVLADLHHWPALAEGERVKPRIAATLARCRDALMHARRMSFPVAFVRRVNNSGLFGQRKRYPTWLEGFEPGRSDMVFEHTMPSCYESPEFAAMAKHANGNFVLAGLFSETTCLSTAVDAHHRGHHCTYLEDASVSRGMGECESETAYRTLTHIISLYSDITSTGTWIHATSLNGGVEWGTK